MPPFSPEHRHEIMAAVDALLRQVLRTCHSSGCRGDSAYPSIPCWIRPNWTSSSKPGR